MENMKRKDHYGSVINSNSIASNWIWLLPIIMLYLNKGGQKLNIKEIDIHSLERKAKLLSRIKGYMGPEEQLIVHRAEMLLHIIEKVKAMMEVPEVFTVGTLSSLSINEKKRHMLMDISEFVDEEKRDVIHKAVDLHIKANHMEQKLKEIQGLESQQLNIESVEKYVELIDPILDDQLKDKSKELKVLMGIVKLVKSLENKESFDEMVLLDIIKPFVSDEQRDQLTKMVQLMKVFSAIGNETSKDTPTTSLSEEPPKALEGSLEMLKEEKPFKHENFSFLEEEPPKE